MTIVLPDKIVEGLAVKFIATKPFRDKVDIEYGRTPITFEDYVHMYVRDNNIGKSEEVESNPWVTLR